MKEKALLDPALVAECKLCIDSKAVLKKLERKVKDAHECGVLSTKEALKLIHELEIVIQRFSTYMHDAQQGKVSVMKRVSMAASERRHRGSLDSISGDINGNLIPQIMDMRNVLKVS